VNLSKDEIARQIHLTLKQLYPENEFDPALIHRMVARTGPEGTGFMFPAREFASASSMETDTFIDDLYRELGIEFEKNWHDKSFFTMIKDNDSIIFKVVGKGFDDQG